MSKPILGVDVDGVCCPSIDGWKAYLEYFNGFGKVVHRTDGMLEYDLSNMYPTVLNPYDYWRKLDYAQFKPVEGSVEALKQLSEHFSIVFISRIKGNHTKSKYYWLREHYPFMTEYVATHGKWVMRGSVVAMTDDRLDVLEGFPLEKRVLYKTPYTQHTSCDVGYCIEDWKSMDVYNFINYLLRI
jgi:5'(3')-deoxyribonucleotidase